MGWFTVHFRMKGTQDDKFTHFIAKNNFDAKCQFFEIYPTDTYEVLEVECHLIGE